MINSDAAVGLSGFLEWSQPVIYDLLVESYEARLEPGPLPRGLARLHARLWRALMAGDMPAYAVLRQNLVEALDECRLDIADLADADARILAELLEIVMSRYQRSMRTAKHYHLALIALAGRLAPPLRAA
ncbi:MAG: hypothetical protein ABR970_22845 [Roseiarcus sp.]|jgi:class 3 adenylate cyclase